MKYLPDLLEAINAVEEENHEQAIEILNELLLDNPNNAVILLNRGYASYRQGKLDEALEYLRKSREIDPEYDLTNLYLARVLLSKNKLSLYQEKVIDITGLNVDSLFTMLDQELYLQKEHQWRIINLDPKGGLEDVELIFAQLYYNNKRYNKAIDLYSELLDMREHELYHRFAWMQYPGDIGGHAYPREPWDRLDKSPPVDEIGDCFGYPDDNYYHSIFIRMGLSLGFLGKEEESLEVFSKLVEIGGEKAEFYFHRGMAYDNMGLKEQAISSYDQALDLDPSFHVAKINKANILCQQKEIVQALALLDEVLAEDAQQKAAWNNKISCYRQLGQLKEALDCCKKCIELDPSDYLNMTNQGILLNEMQRYRDATASFDNALKIHSTYLPALLGIGISYHNNGEYQQSLIYLNKASLRDKNNVEILGWKGMNHYQLEEYEQALEAFDRALELGPASQFLKDQRLSTIGKLVIARTHRIIGILGDEDKIKLKKLAKELQTDVDELRSWLEKNDLAIRTMIRFEMDKKYFRRIFG